MEDHPVLDHRGTVITPTSRISKSRISGNLFSVGVLPRESGKITPPVLPRFYYLIRLELGQLVPWIPGRPWGKIDVRAVSRGVEGRIFPSEIEPRDLLEFRRGVAREGLQDG